MKVLVTSGATREPIDSVRFISNLSSGRTGVAICEALAAHGFGVTQVHGVDSAIAAGVFQRESFTDHASLDAILRRLLKDGTLGAVIHTAAVGDFTVAEPASRRKLDSGRELVIRLRPNKKIIDGIRSYAANLDLTLIGFKLTHDPDAGTRARAVLELLRRSRADFVVHHDVATIGSGAGHQFVIHARDGEDLSRCAGREALATALVTLLERQDSRSHA